MKRLLMPVMFGALAACGQEQEAAPVELPQPSGPPIVQQVQPDAAGPTIQPGLIWDSVASGEGTALRLNNPDGSLRMSIACLANPGRLVANVPAFTPVGSEDRFALAIGAEPVTLVADPTRQRLRPGVTGEAPIPDNLAALLRAADDVGALYGAQSVGPHIPPSRELADTLISACADLRG